MKTSQFILVFLLCASLSFQGKGQSLLALVESTGDGCGVISDCDMNTICFDIILTPDVTADVQSYNIWVQYQETGLSYFSDDACITDNGNDNDLDELQVYRVAGIIGDEQVMAGVPIIVHNICFTYEDLQLLDGSTIYVGGTVLGTLFSTLTYNMPPSNEPMLFPPVPLVMTAGTISCLELLPLKLLSFRATKEGETALLDWAAIQELNSSFVIERATEAEPFKEIGTVAALGATGSNQSYEYRDLFPARGVNYYRLRYINENGLNEFSPIQSVSFGTSNVFVRVWPNPVVENELNIRVRNEQEVETEIRLVSTAGAEVLYQKAFDPDIQETLDVSVFPPGVYTLVVESAVRRFVEKVVIVE